jgi:hypothetical protein
MVLGAAAGLAGLGLAIVSLLALVVGGTGAAAIYTSATLLAALWMIVAPLLAALLPRRGQRQSSPVPHLLGAAILPAAMIAGLVIAQLLLPAGA